MRRTVENTLALCHCVTPTPSRLFTERFYSQALDQERDVCIYLPEHFDPEQTYPIIYATDGQVIVSERYKAILDSLIGNRIVPPLVLVGAYSDETTAEDGMEFRYYEYIAGADEPDGEAAGNNKPGGEADGDNKPDVEAASNNKPGGEAAGSDGTDPRIAGRFGRHLRFFTRELRDTLLRRHAICRDTGKTLFFGCSNGGDYGLTLWGTLPVGSFSSYICLSPVGTDADEVVPCRSGSTLYVAYGEQEAAMPVIGDNLRALHERLEAIGDGSVTVRIFAGGHDRTCWEREFATALTVLMNR